MFGGTCTNNVYKVLYIITSLSLDPVYKMVSMDNSCVLLAKTVQTFSSSNGKILHQESSFYIDPTKNGHF